MTNHPTGTVTFLFTDVEASTRRWEDHPSAMKDATARHDAMVRSEIESRRGYVFTTAGDAFCAAFEDPVAAAEAAVAAQLAIEEEDWGPVAPFRVRMALHTGNADERDGDYFGPPLNRTARLLATGYGGQIIVSAVTAELIAHGEGASISLEDLGVHDLKDLDRPEHVFQVCHSDLDQDFPPLRSEDSDSPEQLLAAAREASENESWDEARQRYLTADEATDLTADDLRRWGEAAWWSGHNEDATSIRERAYNAYVSDGETEQAAFIALQQYEAYKYKLATAVSNAWLARSKRLLEGAEETSTYGWLLRMEGEKAFTSDSDAQTALDLAERALEIGKATGDRSLEALALQDKGRFLVSMGQIDEGMALVDEAMLAAVSGEMDAQATGRSYCNMLGVCDLVSDFERAREWSEAAEAWCESHADSGFPGVCRVFKAELKRRSGDWDDAMHELDMAIGELHAFTPIIGAAEHQIGEVDIRAGRFAEAEERFRSANEHGYTPMPGLARLRLRQGDPEAAGQLIEDGLERSGDSALARVRLLPLAVEVAIAQYRFDDAAEILDEIETTTQLTGSSALEATAHQLRGQLLVASGEYDRAATHLHQAVSGWTALQMPYETARSRQVLAEAFAGRGNVESASMEYDSAKRTFESLGAAFDLEALDR